MKTYKYYFSQKSYVQSVIVGAIILSLSLVVQFYASVYAASVSNSSVTDIILSNTNVHDVDGIFVYGSVLLTLIMIYICFAQLRYLPFVMKSIGTFTLIRSVFVSLTHISPFPNHMVISSIFFHREIFNGIFFGNDLFFSGHTGIPFLFALIFWDNRFLRYLFLCFSFTFAIVVLLGHLHYSIDVLSAFFITYSIFPYLPFLFQKR